MNLANSDFGMRKWTTADWAPSPRTPFFAAFRAWRSAHSLAWSSMFVVQNRRPGP
ncbi:hypothetical protein [Streptomyces sannanensis]|uniref:hypothetical protein n=1 Tax=Streptomyces sannanensis TaxID=285536 RepID=UPI0031F133E3